MGLLHANRKYNNVEQLVDRIDDYFKSITKLVETDVVNQNDECYTTVSFLERPSIFRLCRHCNITNETLLQYHKLEGFTEAINYAKKVIEEFHVDMLADKNKATAGVMFQLKNNFGWKDATQIEQTNKNLNVDVDLRTKTPAQIEEMIRDLRNKTGLE